MKYDGISSKDISQIITSTLEGKWIVSQGSVASFLGALKKLKLVEMIKIPNGKYFTVKTKNGYDYTFETYNTIWKITEAGKTKYLNWNDDGS